MAAETVGLVLGGIPILIWATDQYREPVKTFFKYERVLRTFRHDLILQQEQLHATLRMIGITDFPPAPGDIEAGLSHMSPGPYEAFINIIQEMSQTIERLLTKFKISINGKPSWTTDPPERVKWEWSKVKRSLGSKERREAIDDLQRRNTALKNCLEQQELSSATGSTYAIGILQKQFSLELCNTIRDHVATIHRALKCGWGCKCPLAHQVTLDIQWHSNHAAFQSNQGFHLALSYPPTNCRGGGSSCSELWHKTNIWVVEEETTPPQAPADRDKSVSKHMTSKSKPRVKGIGFILPSPKAVPAPCNVGGSPTLSQVVPEPQIQNLCKAITDKPQCPLKGFLLDPEATEKTRRVFLSPRQKNLAAKQQLVSLRTILESAQVPRQLRLSRKQRLGIAAAMSWAVLYLSDSPWLAETWQNDEVRFFLESKNPQQQELKTTIPCISHLFHDEKPKKGEDPGNNDSSDPLRNLLRCDRVLNRTIFALGIFLIEVGLNRPFEALRRPHSAADSISSVLEDYQRAIELADDDIYFDVGPEYGDAIKRCLRCEFPGRDSTKNFSHVQFRQHFFDGVVAPVQATFDCYSC